MNPEQQKSYDLICALRGQASEGISNYLRHALKISVTEGNFEIFYSQGKPIGYWAWANTVRESVSRLKRTGRYPFFAYEWNEGRISLIIDVCFYSIVGQSSCCIEKIPIKQKDIGF
jgi:hemolysin-activating ACP:hemolysin acyltransferase